jgi:hypothetical protein
MKLDAANTSPTDASAFELGVKAGRAGAWVTDCPYDEDTDRAMAVEWRSGYLSVVLPLIENSLRMEDGV